MLPPDEMRMEKSPIPVRTIGYADLEKRLHSIVTASAFRPTVVREFEFGAVASGFNKYRWFPIKPALASVNRLPLPSAKAGIRLLLDCRDDQAHLHFATCSPGAK